MKQLWKLAALGALAISAHAAPVLYGITFGNQLIQINTTTGAGTLVGPLSTPMAAFGLAVSGGNLYTFDQTADLIRQLNSVTGGTVASIDIGTGNIAGEGALTLANNGKGFLARSQGAIGTLYAIDILAGTTSVVGLSGSSIDGLDSFGGTLYGVSQGALNLYTVNPTTGATTLVGLSGIGADEYTLGGLSIDANGNAFSVGSNTGGASTLYSVNLKTGAATAVGDIGFNGLSGLTFLDAKGPVDPPSGVPEPGTMALVGAGIVFAAARLRKNPAR